MMVSIYMHRNVEMKATGTKTHKKNCRRKINFSKRLKSIIFTDDLDGNEIKIFNVPVQIEIDGRAIEWKQTFKHFLYRYFSQSKILIN